MKIYSGCGNTFMIAQYDEKYDSIEIARSICKDELDGFMLVKTNPLYMHLYNRDGSIASMCGNGIRCFIHYCYDHNLLKTNENIVKTPSGDIYTKIETINPFVVFVGMNKPTFTYTDNKEYFEKEIIIKNHKYNISLVNTGVWHGVIIPKDFNQALIDAKDIRNYELFKENLNVDLVKFSKEYVDGVYVKTYERGVGFTKACGTGSLATYIILKKLGLISSSSISIYTDGGKIIAGIEMCPFIKGPSECIS